MLQPPEPHAQPEHSQDIQHLLSPTLSNRDLDKLLNSYKNDPNRATALRPIIELLASHRQEISASNYVNLMPDAPEDPSGWNPYERLLFYLDLDDSYDILIQDYAQLPDFEDVRRLASVFLLPAAYPQCVNSVREALANPDSLTQKS